MEKYSQFRDKGSGVAPFFPIPPEQTGVYLPLYIILFICRLPILFTLYLTYAVLFAWLPARSLIKRSVLWICLLVHGLWPIDLQVDYVKKGSLARAKQDRLPAAGSVIVSSFTSPIDCLYLAALCDPVFTASYPNTKLVRRISLWQAILGALAPPQLTPAPGTRLVPISALLREYPDAVIVVLPECTTSNGRGVLALSPSILTTPPGTNIYPVNLRYTPSDITTSLPRCYITFLWRLLSRPTHCIRVRIAEAVQNTAYTASNGSSHTTASGSSYSERSSNEAGTMNENGKETDLSDKERKLLDRLADDLARLGRAKRVGLGVREKIEFVKMWTKTRTIW